MFLLAVVVHPANTPDLEGGKRDLAAAEDAFSRLQRIWADQGYTGMLVRWAAEEYGLTVQVVYPEDRQLKRYTPEFLADLGYEPGFRVLPKG
jgi:putative transposase